MKGFGAEPAGKSTGRSHGERQIRGVPSSEPYRRAGVWRACCPNSQAGGEGGI